MNNLFITALAVVAGISIGTGVIHMAVGLRRRTVDLLYFTFSSFAIAYGLNLVSVIGMYQATTIDAFLAAETWNGIFVSITLISLIWFTALYTNFKPRYFLIGLTTVIVIIMVLHTSSPTHLYDEVLGILIYNLAWGESIAILEATESIWLTVFLVTELCVLGFILIAGVRQYRRGEKSHAIMLLIGMSLLISTLAFDIFFIESGVVNFVFVSDFGFLPIAVMMAAVLATQVMQTEEELTKYQIHLEDLVGQRTEELETTNSRLAEEIIERQKAEIELRQTNRRIRAMLESTPESVLLTDHEGVILDLNEVAAKRLDARVEEATGRNAFDFFEENVANRRELVWSQLLESKKLVRMEDERGGRNYRNILYPILNDSGEVGSISVYSQDITEQLQAERNLLKRISELDTLLKIAHSVTTLDALSSTLQNVAELVTGLFDARYTHFILLEKEEERIVALNGFDREAGPLDRLPLDIPLEELSITKTVLSGESRILRDVQGLDIHPSISEFLHAQDIHHIMLIPLPGGERSEGLMSVSRDTVEHEFDLEDVKLCEIIAADVSLAIENLRLQGQGKETAALEERNRIARDLHDAVTQTLYSAGLIAEALPRLWERDADEGLLGLAKLRTLMRGALAEMRILLFELRPESTNLADLSSLLAHLGNALAGRTQVAVSMDFDESVVIPEEVKINLYRIAQEATNNIEKHAMASQVGIEMTSYNSGVILRVSDDGQGLGPNERTDTGLGLAIMHERAEDIGADVEIRSTDREGTELIVHWPCEGVLNDTSEDVGK